MVSDMLPHFEVTTTVFHIFLSILKLFEIKGYSQNDAVCESLGITMHPHTPYISRKRKSYFVILYKVCEDSSGCAQIAHP